MSRGEIGAGLVVIHRIVGGSTPSGFVMQGDHNPQPDPWHPHPADVVGAAWVHLPRLGGLMVLLHQPVVPAAIASVAAALAVLRFGRGKERCLRTNARVAAPGEGQSPLDTATQIGRTAQGDQH